MNKTNRIVTIHSFSSSGIGGVEVLVRSLHKIANNLGLKNFEIFAETGMSNLFDTNSREQIVLPNVFGSSLMKRIIRLALWRRSINKNVKEKSIICVFNPGTLIYLNKKALQKNVIVLVQTNRYQTFVGGWLKKQLLSLTGKYIDKVIVYTAFDEQEFLTVFPANKLAVIPRGCRIPIAKSKPALSKNLVTVARINEKQKNFDSMVEVMRILPKDFTLTIYGDGDPSEIDLLKEKISPYGNIQFKGVVRDIETILQNYSLFIMTSHYEGFGQTLIEARSQGLPIVLYDTFPAARWIVKDNEAGILIPPYDVRRYAEAIEEIVNNERTYSYYVNNAFKYAAETDMDDIEKKWLQLIQTLTNDNASAIGSGISSHT